MLSIGRDAGAGGDAVDMHGAGAAQRHAAAELRAGHAEHVAQHPQQRRVAVDIDAVRLSVDFDGEGHGVVLLRCVVTISERVGATGACVQAALDQLAATSMTASAKACGASCGRLCPMPPLMSRCSYLPENFLA